MEEKIKSPVPDEKTHRNLGKIGLFVMVVGLIILYYDGISLMQTVSPEYQYYEHPQIHIPLIFMMVSFVGIGIFLYNFSKGRNVI